MAELPRSPQFTADMILDHARRNQSNGFEEFLGTDQLGDSCHRAVWYHWRWIAPATYSGVRLRQIERDAEECDRLIASLAKVGIDIRRFNMSGPQWPQFDETGHIASDPNAVAIGFPEAKKTWHLCAFGAVNEKSFRELVKNGLQDAAPKRWVEVQTSMVLFGLERTMLIVVNKNDDELYQERIEVDAAEGLRLLAAGKRIVESIDPPERISRDPAWFECRSCRHAGTCHGTIMAPKHCRSCMHAETIDGGLWQCGLYGKKLSREAQERGCDSHLYLPSLVAGEQVDVIQRNAAAPIEGIVYQMRDGSRWVDGGLKVQLDDEIPF